ncbi:hypothetical protein LCGC14_0845610 [marine sediment metagenome]|uniref:Terminase large subunit gp17-like C-terminal domain-containing protein n=1 Tax=marine sediment metagenome TaxID=412755 RepID=A0A0F9PBW5_9ZZZZ
MNNTQAITDVQQLEKYSGVLAGLSLQDIEHEEARRCEGSLRTYVEAAWPILEPKNVFKPGWHIDAICEHLQAMTEGQITRLIINMPMRHMKSLTTGGFWPSWEWGPYNRPESRWVYSSYADSLSTRDSRKARNLIQSPWYKQYWGDRFHLTGDQNEKKRYENNKLGYRLATTIKGVGTGEGGDHICVDDPHNVLQVESVTRRVEVIHWWDETMSSRSDDPATVTFLIVCHRTHEGDLSGHVLAKETGYEHLCLPARYEGNRIVTSIGKEDPRTIQGEPLWKEQYPEKELRKLEKDLGSQYAIAGQMQQRPAPREGGGFNITDFEIIKAFDQSKVVKSIRYWDKAGTAGGTGAQTAGTLMHKLAEDIYDEQGEVIEIEYEYIIEDVISGRWEAPQREKRISQTMILDGKKVVTWVEQEPGSGGKESAQGTQRRNPGYRVRKDRVTGSKEVRAEEYQVQVEAHTVKLIEGPWNKQFLDRHEGWPTAVLKDEVDSTSGAFNKLNEEGTVFFG